MLSFNRFSRAKISKYTALAATVMLLPACTSQMNGMHEDGDNRDFASGSYAWVAAGAGSQQVARFISSSKSCPSINIDGALQVMTERAKDNGPAHFEQVVVCESNLPQGVQAASINGIELALLPQRPQKIVIMGDTGCRMKGNKFQNCNNIDGQGKPWLFAKLVKSVMAEQPDLVVHVGDYHYRESPCPVGNKGCVGPWGFNWASWEVDFFEPAKPLLNKVAWIFSRGNHEDCDRAYKGWFYLLDPNPLYPDPWSKCQQYSPAYKVDMGDLSIIEMDSATLPGAFSAEINPKTVAQYAAMFNQVNALSASSQNSWMATHRPIWAISSYYNLSTAKDSLSMSDKTMQAALKASTAGVFDDKIKLLLAGHIHNFEAVLFTDQRPDLMVIGDSGTLLSPPFTAKQSSQKTKILAELGVKAENFFTSSQFAYVVMERQPHGAWAAHFVDIEGNTQQRFILTDKRLEPVYE